MNKKSFAEFRTLGFLWLINTTVFHPRGYAMAFHMDEDGEVSGWSLMGDGTEPWRFSDTMDVDSHFNEVEKVLFDLKHHVGEETEVDDA